MLTASVQVTLADLSSYQDRDTIRPTTDMIVSKGTPVFVSDTNAHLLMPTLASTAIASSCTGFDILRWTNT